MSPGDVAPTRSLILDGALVLIARFRRGLENGNTREEGTWVA